MDAVSPHPQKPEASIPILEQGTPGSFLIGVILLSLDLGYAEFRSQTWNFEWEVLHNVECKDHKGSEKKWP